MGLIKAGAGAVGGVLADQWKEFFYCEAIPADVLARHFDTMDNLKHATVEELTEIPDIGEVTADAIVTGAKPSRSELSM